MAHLYMETIYVQKVKLGLYVILAIFMENFGDKNINNHKIIIANLAKILIFKLI